MANNNPLPFKVIDREPGTSASEIFQVNDTFTVTMDEATTSIDIQGVTATAFSRDGQRHVAGELQKGQDEYEFVMIIAGTMLRGFVIRNVPGDPVGDPGTWEAEEDLGGGDPKN